MQKMNQSAKRMPPVRVELTTSRLLGGRGNQLRQGGRTEFQYYLIIKKI